MCAIFPPIHVDNRRSISNLGSDPLAEHRVECLAIRVRRKVVDIDNEDLTVAHTLSLLVAALLMMNDAIETDQFELQLGREPLSNVRHLVLETLRYPVFD